MRHSNRESAPLMPDDDEHADEKMHDDMVCDAVPGPWLIQRKSAQKAASSSRKLDLVLGSLVLVAVYILGFATCFLWGVGRSPNVYSTDFRPAREAVEMERVRFTGTAMFDEQGDPYFTYSDNETVWVGGQPSEAMNEEWGQLIKERYFLITDEEALEAWGPGYEQYFRVPDTETNKGGYVAGLDVLHTLHCVNVLRETIYADVDDGQSRGSDAFQRYHTDHCINIIRQSIQCHGDLTLIPTRWWPTLGRHGRNFIDSDQEHTCRNFAKIRQWASWRWNWRHRVYEEKQPTPAV